MRKIWFGILLLLLLFLQFNKTPIFADSACPTNDPCSTAGSASDKVSCYTNIVNICATQRESMTAQLVYLTTKISLTNAQIESARQKIGDLEKEIESLNQKIDGLEQSLTKTTAILIERIVATYKNSTTSYLDLLLTSNKFSVFFGKLKYVQTLQTHDRRLLFQLQNSKVNFQDQKQLREDKKKELADLQQQLEAKQVTLQIQEKEKELFLETTRNSEAKYQQELAAAQKEAEGIQQAASILSSAGVAKHVNSGDVIGVMGNTGYSTGSHLHFAVYNLSESELNKFNFNSGYENPANDLASRQMTFDPSSCDDVSTNQRITKGIGSGSWNWPMSNPYISQCFGHTPWSWRYPIGIHNGLDMYDDVDTLVRTVDSGNAYVYRGGQSAGNGVFIFHNNGKMTLYWHLQ